MDIEELARQFNKTPEEIRAIVRPMLRALDAFCQTEGSDEDIARFKQTEGGKAFCDAIKRQEPAGE